MESISGSWAPYRLNFVFEARTSRASMRHKDTYIVRLSDNCGRVGFGEAALFRGLSADDVPDFESVLDYYCSHPGEIDNCNYSAVRFGIETALRNMRRGMTPWSGRIDINGLIWMGDRATMAQRIDAKLADGFKLLKLKIGGIDFEDEVGLLRVIRRRYASETLELRLDANGAFTPKNALERLRVLSEYGIHSIEQPIRAGQHEAMRRICAESPIDIALDEELIGCSTVEHKDELLDFVCPRYIILKPALCGGLSGADEWADAAERHGVGYWFTSALESNIGLDAIARAVVNRACKMPQGLGTGELYDNNVVSPIVRHGSVLCYDADRYWKMPELRWNTPIF
ncbi:MAG: o-succinylbenzoate synthase [Muribaculaceae bacterium]|nr:o-succinylbenzoate synthase [Muribaculaceae bacterium]